MREITERMAADAALDDTLDLTLSLSFEARQRSRQRVVLDDGSEAALLLPRGTVLRGGDVLRASDGVRLGVVAAPEEVSTAHSSDPRCLLRAAYHLGNRHVPVELGEGFVRYLHDHVLDDLVRSLGLAVVCERSPFEPEAGAYARGAGHPGHGGEPHEHPHHAG